MYFDSSCCNGFAKVANERHKQTNITVSTLYLLRRAHWNFDFEHLSSLGFYHSKPPIFCHHSPLTSKTCRKVFSNPPHHSHITPWLCSLIVASSAHSLNLILCCIITNLHFKWQTPASWLQVSSTPPHPSKYINDCCIHLFHKHNTNSQAFLFHQMFSIISS